jgi:acetyl-CoA synthetase
MKNSQEQFYSHQEDEGYFSPSPEFCKQANFKDENYYRKYDRPNFPDCFEDMAKLIDWHRPYSSVLDTNNAPYWKWFVDGKLNASYNCIDRHLIADADKVAFIFVPEPETEQEIRVSYRELYKRVNEVSALLLDIGLRKGDRVTLYMPMILELPITMLACARLGIIHSQVFSGFSGNACGERIQDSGSGVLITADSFWRNGKLIDHKQSADIAADVARQLGQNVSKVLVWYRNDEYGSSAPMVAGRDIDARKEIEKFKETIIEPIAMDSNDPLFLIYTSGTTGKPKGIQHGTGGYMAYVTATTKWIQDIHPEDVYWCMADIGWITGHSYIVYGPLSVGATSIIYEGNPIYPNPSRPWAIAERYGVNIFHTSPTAIRLLKKLGPNEPQKYNYKFKCMTTVGEPIEPVVWRWYYNVVGKKNAVITDTWWQSETGGFLCSTIPALQKMKPGSAGPGLPGIYPAILNDAGEVIPKGSKKAGDLCITNPWPGQMQTIWGDDERYLKTYYSKYSRKTNSNDWQDWIYLSGDSAVQSADGYIRILGRSDDVINVAGHRLGTKEIESACLLVDKVAEAAVVPISDKLKGQLPIVFVSLNQDTNSSVEIIDEINKKIEITIGKIAKPHQVLIVPDMPKTRSGKIMRRILMSLINGKNPGDTTTLANPEVVPIISGLIAEFYINSDK